MGWLHVNIKIRKTNRDGMVRLETAGEIMEVMINEDFLEPESETISICFRGEHSSGIIDFSPKELSKLMNTVKRRLHLIKGMKKLD